MKPIVFDLAKNEGNKMEGKEVKNRKILNYPIYFL
jgi:hypothetical protein